jgi:ATP/maltotriose-dependent transcriptional regulator MalT
VTSANVASKLRPPTLPRHAIARPRVRDALDRCAVARVTIVAAAAGSGKTTAVSDWAQSRPAGGAWCTVGPGHNEMTRFWRHLLGAPGFEVVDLPMEQLSVETSDAFVGELVDRCEQADELPTLIVDGFDAISDPAVLESLDAFVTSAPSTMHFVLVGRTRPYLPGLARLRASDDVRTIGFDDLRFDLNEASQLLERLGVSLDVAQVRTLVHRTEGWAAGVQLAGMAVRDARDPVAALDQFGGSTPDVADYFSSEVLDGLPDDARRFVKDTSISEVLTASFCGFLTERSDVASLLGTLERAGVLLQGHDHDGDAFRCPRLLREMLELALARDEPGRHRELHRRAVEWCERTGDDDGALRHALRAGETKSAWSRFGEAMVRQLYLGRHDVLAGWSRLMAQDTSDLRPDRALILAIALVYLGRSNEARTWLARADAEATEEWHAKPVFSAWLAYARYIAEFADGHLLEAARLGSDARRLLDAAAPGEWERSRSPRGRATLLSLLGRYDRARAVQSEYRLATRELLPGDEVMFDAIASELELAEGNLADAERLARRGRQREALLGGPFGYELPYVLGSVLLERNEVDAAASQLRNAIDRGDRVGFAHSRVLPRLAMARAFWARGQRSRASEVLAEARTCLDTEARVLQQRCLEVEAGLLLLEGDFDLAARVIRRLAEPCASRMNARLHACGGDSESALDSLQRVTNTTARERIDALLIRARVAETDEQRDEYVHDALTLAEPHRYVRVFIDESAWIQPVMTRLVGTWSSGYPVELVSILATEPLSLRMVSGARGLTPREQEVLRYLGTPLSMNEIARALFVSRNTVKSHVRSIYSKLAVGTRREAVALHRRETESTWPA